MTRGTRIRADLRADIEALRRDRAEAAAKADALADVLDRFPSKEIRTELEFWCRKIDAYDRALASMST